MNKRLLLLLLPIFASITVVAHLAIATPGPQHATPQSRTPVAVQLAAPALVPGTPQAPAPTVIPTKTFTAPPTPTPQRTITPASSFTPFPTATPVPTVGRINEVVGFLGANQHRAKRSTLAAFAQTFDAQKSIEFNVAGRPIHAERWRIVYRAPDECLVQIFDAKGTLERTEYSIGSRTTIVGGRVRQVVDDPEPRAQERLADFVNLDMRDDSILDFKHIGSDIWIPNTFERNSGVRKVHESLNGVTVNADVSAAMAQGRFQ